MVHVWFTLARLNADLLALALRSVRLGWIGGAGPSIEEPQRHPDLIALGLDRMPSSWDDLRKAYRSAARTAHPDVHGGSQQAFLAVSGAFERLSEKVRGRTA